MNNELTAERAKINASRDGKNGRTVERALAAFDLAHPEVIEAIKAAFAAEVAARAAARAVAQDADLEKTAPPVGPACWSAPVKIAPVRARNWRCKNPSLCGDPSCDGTECY